MAVADASDLSVITPSGTSKVVLANGVAALSAVAEAVCNIINSGALFAGKAAISPSTKKLYIYCDDSKWHAVIPVSMDGVQMLTLAEEGINELS